MESQQCPVVQIPTDFLPSHRAALYTYMTNDRQLTQSKWRTLYKAIDILDKAQIMVAGRFRTFRQVYQERMDSVFADPYIARLLELEDVPGQSPALMAAFARRASTAIKESGLIRRDNPDSWLLWAYCIYWWQSFARGYAFEVEILQDLTLSGLSFVAHNLSSRYERFSPADLVVLDLLGDLKTSIYFLQTETGDLPNGFYITRLREAGHKHTLVVFQKTHAWDKINGETVDGTLSNVLVLLPRPVRLRQGKHELIVVEYETWKRKVLNIQRGGSHE